MNTEEKYRSKAGGAETGTGAKQEEQGQERTRGLGGGCSCLNCDTRSTPPRVTGRAVARPKIKGVSGFVLRGEGGSEFWV